MAAFGTGLLSQQSSALENRASLQAIDALLFHSRLSNRVLGYLRSHSLRIPNLSDQLVAAGHMSSIASLDQPGEADLQQTDKDKQKNPRDFEQHYGSSSTSVRDILNEILEDMIYFKHVHRWDDKLFVPLVKQLSAAIRKYLNSNSLNLNFLLAYSTVEEVLTRGGINHVYRAMAHPGDIERHLFFLAHPLKEPHAEVAQLSPAHLAGDGSSDTATDSDPCAMRGRIIYLDQNLQYLQRASILFSYAFCIRLQFEQYGYIYKFIERHLSLQNTIRMPNHWHETVGPEEDSSRQKIYRRASISCHVTYLTLNAHDANVDAKDVLDRTSVFPFHNQKNAPSPTGLYPFKASTSILLTIAVPEVIGNAPEEIKLWTVLVVNTPSDFASDRGAHEHLTPIAQYFRAIASSLITAKINTQSILDILRQKLQDCEGGCLFDDENFTKSNIYHWTVRTCDELQSCNASTLRFVHRIMDTHVAKLRREAHPSEKVGVDYWVGQLEDELFNLEDLQDQILGLKGQVQESRNALHGIMAVLEARAALQQGERMKTLSYLATLYLPLTAAASIYSMSVLPSSTTLYSFFIVLVTLLLFTIATAVYLPALLTSVLPLLCQYLQKAKTLSESSGFTPCLQEIIGILNLHHRGSLLFSNRHDPKWLTNHKRSYRLFRFLRFTFRRLPAGIVRDCLVPEIMLPRDKWVMMQYLNNRYQRIQWRACWFMIDVVRFLLLPVWLVLIVGIMAYIVVLDLLFWILRLVIKILCCCFWRKKSDKS